MLTLAVGSPVALHEQNLRSSPDRPEHCSKGIALCSVMPYMGSRRSRSPRRVRGQLSFGHEVCTHQQVKSTKRMSEIIVHVPAQPTHTNPEQPITTQLTPRSASEKSPARVGACSDSRGWELRNDRFRGSPKVIRSEEFNLQGTTDLANISTGQTQHLSNRKRATK